MSEQDFFKKIAEQNPEVASAIEAEAARQGVILSIEHITAFTAAIVSFGASWSFSTASRTYGLTKDTVASLTEDFSINLYANGTSTGLEAVIESSLG